LIDRVALDSYDPEAERYGGPDLILDAERVFHADSVATVALLQVLDGLAASDQALGDPVLVGGLSILDLLTGFDGSGDLRCGGSTTRWLLHTAATQRDQRSAFTRRRAEALALADAGGDWAALGARQGGPTVLEAWRGRRAAVAAYGRRVPAGEWTRPDAVAASLVHMHCNRLFGVDRTLEAQALAVASNIVRAWVDRERAERRVRVPR
jgi:thiopeptide-type bacteriocin biosynthesis protein